MATLANPFFFESPSDKWNFTDRETLVPSLVALMRDPGRRLLVFGRRRMGKTSLIKNAAAKGKATLLYCDASTAANLNELAKKILDAAPPEKGGHLAKALELAGKYFKSVGVTAGKIVFSGELRAEAGASNLENVLNLLDERAAVKDEAWSICIDEFQELRELGGPRIDWKLRGVMQQHRHLTYIFTGSDHRIVEWMTEPSAPFFKQLQQMEIGPINPEHLAHWIEKRAAMGGLPSFPYGRDIVELAGPCTGDVVRLAKAVFDLAAKKTPGSLVPEAFDLIATKELGTEFLNYWRPLPLTQRTVLRAIAENKLPLAADTIRDYGLNAASTAASALEALIARQLLVRYQGKVIFDNPFFRRWVALNGVPARDKIP